MVQKVAFIIEQYLRIKKKYLNILLFYQMGDFYELFYEDAVKISKILNIKLTYKKFVTQLNVPMAGIPISSFDYYALKLVKLGLSIAVCNQIVGHYDKYYKHLILRKVIRVITPGTISHNDYLDKYKDNYIISIYFLLNTVNIGLAVLELMSGRFYVYELNSVYDLYVELLRYNPSEILYPNNISILPVLKEYNVKICDSLYFSFFYTYKLLLKHFHVIDLHCFGISKQWMCVRAAGCLLSYVSYTQIVTLSHINKLVFKNINKYITLNASTIKNLELFENYLHSNKKTLTLFSILDNTMTLMGKRMLRRWILSPLRDLKVLWYRHKIMFLLKTDYNRIRNILSHIGDVERILGRVVLRNIQWKELLIFKSYLKYIYILMLFISKKFTQHENIFLIEYMNKYSYIIQNIVNLLDISLVDVENTNSIIAYGYNRKLDRLRYLDTSYSSYISQLELHERKKHNLAKLVINYNKRYGYYIQLHINYIKCVPEYYQKLQVLKNVVRFTFVKLQNYEKKICYVKQQINLLEKKILEQILDKIINYVQFLKKIFSYVAQIDVLTNFIDRSIILHYVKPVFTNISGIQIIKGRHPILENNMLFDFIPNDLFFDTSLRNLIITGPNMSGKSTYMRQIALITIMAYIGSYVPVNSLIIGPIDKILTRIGFHDDISSGKSTFMVEMSDISNIINTSTKNSLILIDELGRGTSVLEGIALAWSCLEYIVRYIKPMLLFATHYLELTKMESLYNSIKNVYFDYLVHQKKLLLLYKLKFGICYKSYGIELADKSGIPKCILVSSFKKLKQLSMHYLTFFNPKQLLEYKFCFNKKHDIFFKLILDIDINKLVFSQLLRKIRILKKYIKLYIIKS